MPAGWPFFVLAVVCASIGVWDKVRTPAATANRAWMGWAALGAVLFGWGLAGGLYAVYGLSEGRRLHHRIDPASVTAVELQPGVHQASIPTLVRAPVRATAPGALSAVGIALRDAQPWTRATGIHQWSVRMTVEDGRSALHYVVLATADRRAFITLFSEGDHGWVHGVWRADALFDLLPALASGG